MKYKSLIFLRSVVHKKNRILNFKRPKWKILQNIFRTKYGKKPFISPNYKGKRKNLSNLFSQKTVVTTPKWTRLFKLYKYLLQTKVKFQWFFGKNMSLQKLKSFHSKHSSTYPFAVTYEYRAENVIWRSGFFFDVAQVRQAIIHRKVFLNGQLLTHPNLLLKKGDLICVDLKAFRTLSRTGKLERLPQIFTECNYNTGELFIVSYPDPLLLKQMSYLYDLFLDLPALKNYIRKL